MIRNVLDLPAPLEESLKHRNLIVFDGECVLCSSFYRFVLRYDRAAHFDFATAQSPLGQDLCAALGLSCTDFETNLVLSEGRLYAHLESFAAVMRQVPLPWPVLGLVRFVPGPLKIPLYKLIARNRYRLFGRYDSCMIPDAAAKARFVSGGW